MTLKICLIGSIPKGDEERKNWRDWKIKYKKELSKIGNIEFVDGDAWRDETKPVELFGHDANLIKKSDIIVVNAEEKLEVGSSQEMLIAKYFSKPVITVLPKNTLHRKTNTIFNGALIKDWVHPFILNTSDLIVEKIEDSMKWIKDYSNNPDSKKIKNIKLIDEAIKEYFTGKVV